ncbi:MAG TPA: methyltransferase domain-containing protein [Candidatus Polarisedimenticolia bacterium]|jgi:SAM-dependent methyltransferase|nr:methyltransferase domain-containing protein [Candidatus Polarisedimenticolia bacterium]
MAPTRSRYLHGTQPREQKRLARLNTLINRVSLRELAPRGGERILEVGSGLGQFARDLARAAGTGGRVLGIERSREQIEGARRAARRAGESNLVAWRRGDALALPLRRGEWGSFDVAHARFLLEHVPDPLRVVRAMVRSVRPGGRVVLEDDDHDVLRLWPEPAGFTPLWKAYIRSFDRLGNDPAVGRRLVSLLYEAGARPRRNTWIFFGSCSGSPDFKAYVENAVGVVRSARRAIIDGGLLPAATFDAALRAFDAWKHRPDAALWFAIAWAEGVRPAPGRRVSSRGHADDPN